MKILHQNLSGWSNGTIENSTHLFSNKIIVYLFPTFHGLFYSMYVVPWELQFPLFQPLVSYPIFEL